MREHVNTPVIRLLGSAHQTLFLYLFLEFQYRSDERFGAGRAALYVDVDRDYPIHAFYDMIAMLPVWPPAIGAGTHGDDVFGFGHLFVQPFDALGHFKSNGSGDDDHIRLACGWPRENAVAVEVVSGGEGAHKFNGAAGNAK